MSKITLHVNDNHLSEVMVILKSLKNGMITRMNVESNNTQENSSSNKYLQTQSFKEKYKTPIKSSETKPSRYLSAAEFKQRLKEKS